MIGTMKYERKCEIQNRWDKMQNTWNTLTSVSGANFLQLKLEIEDK